MNFSKLLNDNKYHLLSFISFFVIAIVLTLGETGKEFQNYALSTPDAGVYISFVVAQEHPELFTNDPLLSSKENISDYRMFFYGQVKVLKKFFNNYGSAAMALVPFGIWIHLAGFYILGWVLFRKPFEAVLTAFLLSTPINLGFLRDFWGITLDPIPRFFYQGFLGLLAAFAIHSGHNIKRWPFILGFAGFINYFHPLSTPPITIGIALSLWFSVKNESFLKKFLMMTISGITLIIILAPFLQTFFSSADVGNQSPIPYEIAAPIVIERLSSFSLHPEQAVLSFIGGFSEPIGKTLWLLAWAIALAGLLTFSKKESPELAPFWSIWWIIGGILIGAGLLPTIEHIIYSSQKTFPLEFEMYRGMRYITPFLLGLNLFTIRKFAEIRNLPRKIAIIGSIICLAGWGYYGVIFQKADIAYAFRQSARCFTRGEIFCELPQRDKDFIDVMDALRNHTPPGAKILSEGQEIAIRFHSLRPLVYSYKDGPPFAYTNHQSLMTWYEDYQTMNEIIRMRKHAFRRKGFINNLLKFAYAKDADYLVLSEPYQPEKYNHPALIMIYSNKHYTIFKIAKE